MKINGYELMVVCANYDKDVDGYGDVYDDFHKCLYAHPNSEIIYGYGLKSPNGEETPDWFNTIEEAIDWANNVYTCDELTKELKIMSNRLFDLVTTDEIEATIFARCTTYDKAKKAMEIFKEAGYGDGFAIVRENLPIDSIKTAHEILSVDVVNMNCKIIEL